MLSCLKNRLVGETVAFLDQISADVLMDIPKDAINMLASRPPVTERPYSSDQLYRSHRQAHYVLLADLAPINKTARGGLCCPFATSSCVQNSWPHLSFVLLLLLLTSIDLPVAAIPSKTTSETSYLLHNRVAVIWNGVVAVKYLCRHKNVQPLRIPLL